MGSIRMVDINLTTKYGPLPLQNSVLSGSSVLGKGNAINPQIKNEKTIRATEPIREI